MTQNGIDNGGSNVLQSIMTRDHIDSSGSNVLQSIITQNGIDSGGSNVLQSIMTQSGIDSDGSNALQSIMTLDHFDSGCHPISIDHLINDGDDYEFGLVRIPRRTQSAPPELESLPREKTTLLSLPLETQQQILRNLLNGHDTLTSPIKYTLHPAILRVNKHLSSEGKKILYHENDWILIENASPWLCNQLRLLHVPIASTHHLLRFNEHRMSIRFETDLFNSPHNGCFDGVGCLIRPHAHPRSSVCDLFPHRYREKHPAGRGNLLLHGRDMHLLVRAISILSHCFHGADRVLIVESKRGQRPIYGDLKRLSTCEVPPTTIIRVQRNSYDKWNLLESFKSAHFKRKISTLVEALKGAPGVRQTVIGGDVDYNLAREVKNIVNSKVVFRDAMGWNLVDSLRDYKKDLDDMVYKSDDQDCLCLASVGYQFLDDICRGSYLYSLDRFSDTNIDVLSWETAFCLLASDTSTTLSRIGFHKGNGSWYIIHSGGAGSWFQLLLDRGGVSDMDPSHWINTKHFSAVMHGAEGFCEMARAKLEALIQEAEIKGVPESMLANVWFDLTVVQKHLDEVAHPQSHSGPLDRRVSRDEPRCKHPGLTRRTFSQRTDNFRDHLTNTELAIPRAEGLEGWLDTKETLSQYDLIRLEITPTDVPAVLLGNIG